jgi:hypothetical protein
VWTAPWQELSDADAALVGCGHVYGLFVRLGWPLALMLCADLCQPNYRAKMIANERTVATAHRHAFGRKGE